MLFGSCQFLHLLYYQQNSYQQNNREETYDYQQEPKPILLFFTVKLVRLIYDWKYFGCLYIPQTSIIKIGVIQAFFYVPVSTINVYIVIEQDKSQST